MYATAFAFVRAGPFFSVADAHNTFDGRVAEKMSNQPNISNPPPSGPPPPNFIDVLRLMLRVSDKVSDLIFSPGRPPQIELTGQLQPVRIPGLEKLTPAQTAGIA
jgi:hypothetical protein